MSRTRGHKDWHPPDRHESWRHPGTKADVKHHRTAPLTEQICARCKQQESRCSCPNEANPLDDASEAIMRLNEEEEWAADLASDTSWMDEW